MKVVVTGGAGFIGSNLCRHLEQSPHVSSITVLDDLSTGAMENLIGVSAEVVVGSYLDADVLGRAVEGASAIVHLGARPSVPRSLSDPAATHEANATGTLRVLQAAQTLDDPLVIVASSSSVYGANPTLPKHETLAPMPMSPYGVSKLAAEQYALAWKHSFGVRTLVFRFFNVFGPFQRAGHAYAAVVPAFIDAALRGQPLRIYGDGKQTRDFTYVGTVCEVLGRAIEEGVSSTSPINLAFGTRVNLMELIEVLQDEIGIHLRTEHLAPRTGDVEHSQASSDLLSDLFPDIQAVALRVGVARTLAWFRADAQCADPTEA